MDISEKLAHLNKERFQNFEKQDSKAAIFAYAGDVFNNIQSKNLSENAVKFFTIAFAYHIRLYGALKPLDAIKPYRLEMTAKLNEINDLSKFCKMRSQIILIRRLSIININICSILHHRNIHL